MLLKLQGITGKSYEILTTISRFFLEPAFYFIENSHVSPEGELL